MIYPRTRQVRNEARGGLAFPAAGAFALAVRDRQIDHASLPDRGRAPPENKVAGPSSTERYTSTTLISSIVLERGGASYRNHPGLWANVSALVLFRTPQKKAPAGSLDPRRPDEANRYPRTDAGSLAPGSRDVTASSETIDRSDSVRSYRRALVELPDDKRSSFRQGSLSRNSFNH